MLHFVYLILYFVMQILSRFHLYPYFTVYVYTNGVHVEIIKSGNFCLCLSVYIYPTRWAWICNGDLFSLLFVSTTGRTPPQSLLFSSDLLLLVASFCWISLLQFINFSVYRSSVLLAIWTVSVKISTERFFGTTTFRNRTKARNGSGSVRPEPEPELRLRVQPKLVRIKPEIENSGSG